MSRPVAVAFSPAIRLLIGLIFVLGPLATDMYLPAFPLIEHELGHGAGSAQLTLTCWFVGMAVGQFTIGPFCDRFGRRLPLLMGLGVYVVASALLAVTHDFWSFCALRFIAALGGATTSVAPRAMVRDIATGADGVRLMSQLMLVFGLGPILAPSLGSALLAFGSWRLIFWVAAAFGLVLLICAALALPDTLPPERRFALPVAGIAARYLSLLREPLFLSAAMVASFSTFTMFAYLSNGPLLFEGVLGFSPQGFGLFFGVNAGGFILGTQLNALLVRRIAYTRVMEGGMIVALVAAVIGLLVSVTGVATPAHPWALCVMIGVVTFSLGFIGSNAGILALTRHGHQAGAAAAMIGTMTWALGGVAGVLMALLPADWIGSTATGMLIGATGCWISDLLRRRVDIGTPTPDPVSTPAPTPAPRQASTGL